jgi:hypothetical protein
MSNQSVRAQIVERRTYLRPLDANGTTFETPEQAWRRVINHQHWLWERAKGEPLDMMELAELEELYALFMARKVTVSGRTRWLGGTDVAKTREASQFNCAFSEVQTVHDVVDTIWLLLQGCGVGFKANIGVLNGFTAHIGEIEVIRSTKVLPKDANGDPVSDPALKGNPDNIETFDKATGVWAIKIGDSAEAWAKFFGKIMAFKGRATKLVVDCSEIRPAGYRLSGYGWISSGDTQLIKAVSGIFEVMNRSAGKILSAIDILDIENHLGTILSSRRSAEIALYEYGGPEWEEFAVAKKDHYQNGLPHRAMSNNSLVFYHKPTRRQLNKIFKMIEQAGGSEPGFINGEAALNRAPYFKGVNPSLRAGTRVLTSTGIFSIEALENQTVIVPNLHGVDAPARCILSGKDKRLYEVEISGGYKYMATAEHKWPTRTTFSCGQTADGLVKKTTIELNPGDQIPFTQHDRLFDGVGGTKEQGFFVGWLLGDGWVTQRGDTGQEQIGLIVANSEKDIENRLIAFLRTTGCLASFHPSTSGKSRELNTINKNISDVLKTVGWCGKTQFPDMVWTGTEEFRKGFIDGLISSDGNVDGNRVCLTNKSETLLTDFQDLLGFYGIPMSVGMRNVHAKFPNGTEGDYVVGTARSMRGIATLSHFHKIFTLSSTHKQALISKSVSDNNTRKNTLFLRVKNVTDTGLNEDVWDLQVADDTHCFRLSGVVTGNCAEILLGDKSFCNLVETAVSRFNGDEKGLHRAHWLIARANYRQTCVNLDDGVLQRTWHELNEFLRLCGVGVTGIVGWEFHNDPEAWQELREVALSGVNSMADELGLPRAQLATTVKPSGTQTKVFGNIGDELGEGAHKPMARYIFNRIRFPKDDPIVQACAEAGFDIEIDPYSDGDRLVKIPVEYTGMEFDTIDLVVDGETRAVEVNLESAVDQLDRYKMLQEHYVDHNCSITVSYDLGEVQDIVDWLLDNWDIYVGVSFLYRADPTKTAEDLGFPYLPQQPVDSKTYHDYVSTLSAVNFNGTDRDELLDMEDCATGACPIR